MPAATRAYPKHTAGMAPQCVHPFRHALHMHLRQVQVPGSQGGLEGLLLRSVRVFRQFT
jgi:hypothetical protein